MALVFQQSLPGKCSYNLEKLYGSVTKTETPKAQ